MKRIVLAWAFVAACEGPKPEEAKKAPEAPKAVEVAEIDKSRLALFAALPDVMESKDNPITDDKVALGRMLYFETRMSRNHDISCNSCHLLDKYGVDNKKTSEGHKKQLGTRNSPTVYNAAGHFAQFWDGRAKDVEEQATKPILNPSEMALPNDKACVAVLRSIPEYEQLFKKAFPEAKDAVTYENVGKAIGAFERKLVTPSRWDKYLKGDKNALTAEEKAGFNKFFDTGCIACHTGAYGGGAMYQKLGLVKPYPNQKDQGRFEVTKQDADKMMFKVPGLRNVEKTAPYYHDGSIATLEEAVKDMATYQLGKELKDAEAKSIVAWLNTLTGELPMAYVAQPNLPPKSPKTPKPNPN